MLRTLDLEQACALYDALLAETPGDGELLGLKEEVEKWRERLGRCTDENPRNLYELHFLLAEETQPALREGLLAFLIERLYALPVPELVYLPPRFHLGYVLREAGRHVEAERLFAAALHADITDRGRFLAWRGDALTLCGKNAAALEYYKAAFLEDPDSVDIDTLAHGGIRALLLSLHLECLDEEADDREAAPWLPYWGWLNGVFSLDLHDIAADRETFSAYLHQTDDEGKMPPGNLWYEYLRYAEYLRACSRDDRELVPVRRRMKRLNSDMFARYMGRINGECDGTGS